MLALLAERTFSLAGSLIVVAVLLAPFGVGWLVSFYENRLLAYFSEGTEVLSKGQLIASVLTSTAVPCFMVSFGLLFVSSLFGDAIGFAAVNEAEGMVMPSPMQSLVYVPLTLAASMGCILLARRLGMRKCLPERPVERHLFRRWVAGVNMVGQCLILAVLWGVLFLFPKLANIPLK